MEQRRQVLVRPAPQPQPEAVGLSADPSRGEAVLHREHLHNKCLDKIGRGDTTTRLDGGITQLDGAASGARVEGGLADGGVSVIMMSVWLGSFVVVEGEAVLASPNAWTGALF